MFWIPSTHDYTSIHLTMTSTWSGADGGCFIPFTRHTLVVITNLQHDCLRDSNAEPWKEKPMKIKLRAWHIIFKCSGCQRVTEAFLLYFQIILMHVSVRHVKSWQFKVKTNVREEKGNTASLNGDTGVWFKSWKHMETPLKRTGSSWGGCRTSHCLPFNPPTPTSFLQIKKVKC